MNRWRVGEDRGSKETDRCPLTGTTNTNIDDYTLTPQSAQEKVNNSRLLKVLQWLQDLRQPDSLSDAEYATFMQYCTDFFIDDN
jgi:hypothetical protein